MKIASLRAAQRLDSRGNPTVQVELLVDSEEIFRALVPSGASTGSNEAFELRDGDQSLYQGRSVLKAVRNVEDIIAPALVKEDFLLEKDFQKIDAFLQKLDGSPNKRNLGANAILGVSMACARAAAAAQRIPLYDFIRRESGSKKPWVMPVPFFNVLNGGVHSGNTLAFQEFMIAPVGAKSFEEAVRIGAEVYHKLKAVIQAKFGASAAGIGDEGGFAPPISHPHEALDLLVVAVDAAGHTGKVKFGIDPASSEFFDNDKYNMGMKAKSQDFKTQKQMIDMYHDLLARYPVVLLEDPFSETDWQTWTEFNKTCPIELVGDDLLVTNIKYVQEAQDRKACTSMLLKINQIGTITEAIAAANLAYSFGWSVFVSHRSGETTDDFIGDLVVGLRTGHLKSGAPCRGERVAKYNRLMDIEAELARNGQQHSYAGEKFRTAHGI